MQVEGIFFVSLRNIALPHRLGSDVPLRDGFVLTANPVRKAEITRPVATLLGSVERDFIADDETYIAYKTRPVTLDRLRLDADAIAAVDAELRIIQNAIQSLWLVKDHAIVQETAFLATRIAGRWHLSSNGWTSYQTDARGGEAEVLFSEDELRAGAEVPHEAGPSIKEVDRPTLLEHGSLRYQRFSYFVHQARSSRDVAMKVAQYCSALEAIASSSQSELTHQVAERVASCLHPVGEARLDAFRRIKTAYGFRSRAVHGSSFREKDFAALIASSVYVDELCRRLARLYLDDDSGFSAVVEGGAEAFEAYWQRRILVGT